MWNSVTMYAAPISANLPNLKLRNLNSLCRCRRHGDSVEFWHLSLCLIWKIPCSLTPTHNSQLLEFRNVLAKVIGLEIEATPVPDYEIISRLEKLVEAHQVGLVLVRFALNREMRKGLSAELEAEEIQTLATNFEKLRRTILSYFQCFWFTTNHIVSSLVIEYFHNCPPPFSRISKHLKR